MPFGGVAAPTSVPADKRWKGPPAQVLSMYAAITLGFGVVVGTALDPGLTGLGAVGPQIIQIAGESGDSAEEEVGELDSAVAAAPPPDGTTSGTYPFGSYGSSGSFGGGGGGIVKPKPKYLTGTVAQVNPYSESYALAIGNGPLTSVHADNAPDPGSKVRVKVKELANGTYGQEAAPQIKSRPPVREGVSDRAVGERVGFSGTVSHRNAERGVYAVSSLGVSALVHLPEGHSASDVPEVGDLVQVEAALELAPEAGGADTAGARAVPREATGCQPEDSYPLEPVSPETRLVEISHSVSLTGITNYSITGVVQRSCPEDRGLELSADDLNVSDEIIDLVAPADFDLEMVGLGQTFIIYLQRDEQGSTEVLGLVSDQGRAGAEDETTAQGSTG